MCKAALLNYLRCTDSKTQRLNDSTTQLRNDSTTQLRNDSTTQRLHGSTTHVSKFHSSTAPQFLRYARRSIGSTGSRLNDSTALLQPCEQSATSSLPEFAHTLTVPMCTEYELDLSSPACLPSAPCSPVQIVVMQITRATPFSFFTPMSCPANSLI